MEIKRTQPSFGMALKKPNLRGMSKAEIEAIEAVTPKLKELAEDADLKIAKGIHTFRRIGSAEETKDTVFLNPFSKLNKIIIRFMNRKLELGEVENVYLVIPSKKNKSLVEKIKDAISQKPTIAYISDNIDNATPQVLQESLLNAAQDAIDNFLIKDLKL